MLVIVRVLDRLLTIFIPPLCVACGADAGAAAPLCSDCRGRMSPLRPLRGGLGFDCWAAFPYDGPAGAAVRALKFGGRYALADTMAAQLAAHAPVRFLAGVVVPVPVHPQHRHRRGLDHALALARGLAERTELPLCPCLVRSGDPAPQVGRGRSARIRGPAGAVTVAAGATAPPRALLVDDVVTTGATLAACADALRQAGTAQLSAIAYARTTAR